jgi:hypothetical protein
MKYDGVVIRLEELYLFLLDPNTSEVMDGINISEHTCYSGLKDSQLMVVSVTFKDGTQDVNDLDLEEFIHGESYGKYNIFIHIQDIDLFSISQKSDLKKSTKLTLEDAISNGELSAIVLECIEVSKETDKKNDIENE